MIPANDRAPVHSGATPAGVVAANARCGMEAPRLPPSRPHDEIYVLRALIGGQANPGSVLDVLRPKHFADPLAGIVFRWVRMLVRRGMQPADVQDLERSAGLQADLRTAGEPNYLAVVLEHRLPEGAVLDYPVRQAAVRVLDAYIGRELIAMAGDVCDNARRAMADGFKGNEETRASVCELMAAVEASLHRLALLRGEAVVYD